MLDVKMSPRATGFARTRNMLSSFFIVETKQISGAFELIRHSRGVCSPLMELKQHIKDFLSLLVSKSSLESTGGMIFTQELLSSLFISWQPKEATLFCLVCTFFFVTP